MLAALLRKRASASEVVVGPACTLTTTSMLIGGGCVGVDAQWRLVSTTNAMRKGVEAA